MGWNEDVIAALEQIAGVASDPAAGWNQRVLGLLALIATKPALNLTAEQLALIAQLGGLTASAEELDAAAELVDSLGAGVGNALQAAPNAAGGTIILDAGGKVPAGNLPAASAGGIRITAVGNGVTAGSPASAFIATNAVTATCQIFLSPEGDQPPEAINVVTRTTSGTKGFTVEAMHANYHFNWMIIEPA